MESGTRRGVLAKSMALAAAAVGVAFAGKSAHAQEAPSVAQLQRTIADLNARLAELEAWKANAGVFVANASGTWTFAPHKGDVVVKSPGALTLSGEGIAELAAEGNNATARVRSDGSYEVHAVKRAFP